MKPLKALTLLVTLCCSIGLQAQHNETLTLLDFEKNVEPSQIQNGGNGIFELKEKDGNHLIEATMGYSNKQTGLKIFKGATDTCNLEGWYQVKVDVKNTSKNEIQVELYVGGDNLDPLTSWYCSNFVALKPNETKTLAVELTWFPWVFEPQPDIVAMRGVPGKKKTDLSKIDLFTFGLRYGQEESTFTIDNIRAERRLEVRKLQHFFPFVDQFGQYKYRDWLDKVATKADLKKQAKQEAKILAKDSLTDRNKYGGWLKGPQLKATGFFRTEKIDGQWWMVDPDGYLFWTSGVNCVSTSSYKTGIDYREHYFEKLPAKDSPFYSSQNWSTHGFYKDKLPFKSFNFYAQNLSFKYGSDWLDKFRETTIKRFKSWGLNTIGFVSDSGLIKKKKIPYTGSVWIRNTPKIEGSEGYWGPFHDVFDPNFRIAVRNSVQQQQLGANDPWCIGFFVDNELSWGDSGSLAIGALKSEASQPAKIKFINDLKTKYISISALNKSWESNYENWNALLQSKTPSITNSHPDAIAFYSELADTYFRTINEELKAIAPNNNYLGCRFAWGNNIYVMSAAAKYMDIISFNKYEYSIHHVTLPEGIDKPIMIGEFHYGILDKVSLHVGVRAAKDQADRGVKYQNYIRSGLENPLVVGAHWFQYVDQPITGRGDGENYNVGLIDVCDRPFTELTEKIKETNTNLYEYRYKKMHQK